MKNKISKHDCSKLVSLLLEDDNTVRDKAAARLGELGIQALEPLLDLLKGNVPEAGALRAVVNILADLLFAPQAGPAERMQIIDSVGNTLGRIENNNAFAAWHAADLLASAIGFDNRENKLKQGELADRAFSWLLRALESETPQVRMVSIYGLVVTGSQDALGEIERLSQDDIDIRVRELAEEAVERLERRDRTLSLDRIF